MIVLEMIYPIVLSLYVDELSVSFLSVLLTYNV